MKIAIFGAGAVGSTIGAWLTPVHKDTWLVDLPSVTLPLREKGLTHYCHDEPSKRETIQVNAVEKLADIPGGPDTVLVCVKNYSLEKVSQLIVSQIGKDRAFIVGFQNGVENQRILPQNFTKPIFGIVGYNCWMDGQGVVGYQKRGPLALGVTNHKLTEPATRIAEIINQGVDCNFTDRLQDAAHSKMIVNLTNSLTTLVGHRFKPISDEAVFQKLLSNLTAEGTKIAEAAGITEMRIGGMPSWFLMRAAAKLPRFLTKRAFEKNLKKMVVSSMAQDILQRGSKNSEIDSLNGYFVRLANKHGVDAPYNRAVYELCKKHFAEPNFHPMDVRDVMAAVQAY